MDISCNCESEQTKTRDDIAYALWHAVIRESGIGTELELRLFRSTLWGNALWGDAKPASFGDE